MDFLNETVVDKKIPYEEFVRDDYYDLKEFTFDEQTMEFWRGRNFYTQMMDVWGEVDKARKNYIVWKEIPKSDTSKKRERFLALLKSLKFVRECIAVVKENNDFEEKVKKTFRIAEWELYDFFFWDNEFGNTAETVTRWFDQWCFQINLELLETA